MQGGQLESGFEKVEGSRWFRTVLIALDVIALVFVGYGKSYSGHTNGTVIDQAFLETVRQIVIHERFAIFGTIAAICFLMTTLAIFLREFTELKAIQLKWLGSVTLIFGLCIFTYLLSDVVPIMSKPITVVYDIEESDVTRSTSNDKTPLVNSSDKLVREVDRETTKTAEYYKVYCNGKILRMYHVGKYTLSEDLK